MKNNICKLAISDLRVWVHLGYGKEEKHNPQLVSIDVEIIFNKHPPAVETDQLDDTLCYLKAVESIQALTQKNRFNLIENLGAKVHEAIYNTIKIENHNLYNVNVVVKKMSPPVPGVHGFVSFSYGG